MLLKPHRIKEGGEDMGVDMELNNRSGSLLAGGRIGTADLP